MELLLGLFFLIVGILGISIFVFDTDDIRTIGALILGIICIVASIVFFINYGYSKYKNEFEEKLNSGEIIIQEYSTKQYRIL